MERKAVESPHDPVHPKVFSAGRYRPSASAQPASRGSGHRGEGEELEFLPFSHWLQYRNHLDISRTYIKNVQRCQLRSKLSRVVSWGRFG